MAVTDPIADMLTRIRNGIQARHTYVTVPGSKTKRAVLERMKEEGFISDVHWEEDGKQGLLLVHLKYDKDGVATIDGLRRLSKPGRRVYVRATDIPTAQSGYGTVILSTSRGVMVDRAARELGVGGEVLCAIW